MKKLAAILVIICMMAGFPVYGASIESALFDLQAIGILQGDGDGDFALERAVTRGEYATVVVRLIAAEQAMESLEIPCPFADVAQDDYYAGAVTLLSQMGIVHGTGAGLFEPERTVSLPEAASILVRILGYEADAQARGGYPDGYMATAFMVGLLNGVEMQPEFDRAAMVSLIHNGLMTPIYSEYSDKMTYYDIHTAGKGSDIYKSSGIVTANFRTYLKEARSDIKENEVEIDNIRYRLGDTHADLLLGQSVQFYAIEEQNHRTLLSVEAKPVNQIVTADAQAFEARSLQQAVILSEAGRESKYRLAADAVLVKNGRLVSPYGLADLAVAKGSVRLLDNDGDMQMDCIMIEQYQTVRVKKVENNVITLADDFRIDGRKYFNLEEDDEIHLFFEDADGQPVEPEQIAENSILSVFADNDRQLYVFRVSDQQIEGVFSEISEDSCVVDGQRYPIAKGDTFPVQLADRVTLYLDYRGYAADMRPVQSVEQYGYLCASADGGGVDNRLRIKMLKAAPLSIQYDVNENDLDDKNPIPKIVCRNDGVAVYETADNLRVDGEKYTGGGIAPGVYAYSVNGEGKLSRLEAADLAGGGTAMKYNASDLTFCGNLNRIPFGIDKDTQVLCVPTNADASDRDMEVSVEISNKVANSTFTVEGYAYDTAAKKCKVMVMYRNMDADFIPQIKKNTQSVAMVAAVRNVLGESGETGLKVTLLAGGKSVDETIADDSVAYAKVSRLKKGDLIYFSRTPSGALGEVEVIYGFGQLPREDFYQTVGTTDQYLYGQTVSVEYDEIDVPTGDLQSVVTVNGKSGSRNVSIPQRNQPPVFSVCRDQLAISSLDALAPGQDWLFTVSYQNLVTACVIVK